MNEESQLPNGLIISGLENAAPFSQLAFCQALLDRKIVLRHEDNQVEASHRPTGPLGLAGKIGPSDSIEDVYEFPDEFIVVYVCAMNHQERPAIHKSLVSSYRYLIFNIGVKQHEYWILA